MENASNALLMAAGILISVILISIGTWLFTTFGSYSKTINDNLSQTQIDEFNSQFTKYETTLNDPTTYCTAYDIVSVINLAKDANGKYEEYKNLDERPTNANSENNAYICVNGITVDESSKTEPLNSFIQANNKQIEKTDSKGNKYIDFENKYTCTVIVSDQTKLVKSIKFTQI